MLNSLFRRFSLIFNYILFYYKLIFIFLLLLYFSIIFKHNTFKTVRFDETEDRHNSGRL